jgi:2-C-methyl-D-erythritol 2,4-cyclodiphosphate synthase
VTPSIRVGFGTDLHRIAAGRPLVLGGVTIPHEAGLLGHSDADIVCHALTDALLGAAGLGDIGEHFPDTDPRWKDADSGKLLTTVLAMLKERGWTIVNCDVVIHAQAPKLSPYKEAIRANVARVLGVSHDRVNIKAKTGEHVGPIGRGEAMGCEAVCLIESQRA